jgi:MPBQ/MSBQ methyltransferase
MTWQPNFEAVYDSLIFDPKMREYFGPEGYYNAGYWNTDVTTPEEASRALADRLAEWIPAGAGSIVDVGCGLGATTRRLAELRPQARILGLNFSFRQLAEARSRCPRASLVQMDAARMGLRPDSVDAIFSLEAAFHFWTRADFFREAACVLKPGGILAIADIVFPPEGWPGSYTVPPENFVESAATYVNLLSAAGFSGIRIEDATDLCWGGFCRALTAWSQSTPSLNQAARDHWRAAVPALRAGVTSYLLASASVPG